MLIFPCNQRYILYCFPIQRMIKCFLGSICSLKILEGWPRVIQTKTTVRDGHIILNELCFKKTAQSCFTRVTEKITAQR